jgi:hypothetical protein
VLWWAVDFPACILDVAAQLAPLVRLHAAAIGVTGGTHLALRLGAFRFALRAGWGTPILNHRGPLHSPLERACGRSKRDAARDQAAAQQQQTAAQRARRFAASRMATGYLLPRWRNSRKSHVASLKIKPWMHTSATAPGTHEPRSGFCNKL